jgi:uncharacterized protein DUF6868
VPLKLSFVNEGGQKLHLIAAGARMLPKEEKPMSVELVRSFLMWCTIINYGILLVWFLVFSRAHDWIHRFHGRWFRLSSDQFDALNYAGTSMFKIGIMLFNLVPCIALWIIG